MSDDKSAYQEVPRPFYMIDPELDLMASLRFIMNEETERGLLTEKEIYRIVKWFAERYGEREQES